jgi:hypothetical protein
VHLDGADGAFGAVVRERQCKIDCEAQDHVFVAGESLDQLAALAGEGAVLFVVVGASFGQGAQVVVANLRQDSVVELIGTGGAGLVGGLVGLQQGVGHGLGSQLPEGVGVAERAQVSEQMSCAPGVHGGQVGIPGVPVAHQGAGELW